MLSNNNMKTYIPKIINQILDIKKHFRRKLFFSIFSIPIVKSFVFQYIKTDLSLAIKALRNSKILITMFNAIYRPVKKEWFKEFKENNN